MNAFYQRLVCFGEAIEKASQQSGTHLEELFTVLHPGYPVVAHTRSEKPEIQFEESCPIPLRRKIRQMLRKSFGGRHTDQQLTFVEPEKRILKVAN